MFAGSTYGFNDIAFDDDQRSFFVMKFDFSGELDYSCIDIESVRTNDITDRINGFGGRFEYTDESYLNETTYRHMALVSFDYTIEAHTTLGLYKGEQLCYVSALVSADENYSAAQDLTKMETPPSKYYIGEPAITYTVSDPLFNNFKDDYNVTYLGLEAEEDLTWINRSGYEFEVETDNIDHVGSYLYEFTGCDGE